MLSLMVVGLLVASVVGCASKSALQEVDARVRALQESVRNVERDSKKASNDVNQVETKMTELTERVDGSLKSMQTTLTSIADDVKGVKAEISTLRDATDKRLESLDLRLKAAENAVTTLNKDVNDAKKQIADFASQFKTMSASLAGAQLLMIKNLENTRDIYKTQFLAIEEVLQSLRKEKPKPAPKPPE
jgi:chromosome segregation ATPase